MGAAVWYQERHDNQRILCTTCSYSDIDKYHIGRTNEGVNGDASRTGYSCASDLWVSRARLPQSLSAGTPHPAIIRHDAVCTSFTWNSAIVSTLFKVLEELHSRPPPSRRRKNAPFRACRDPAESHPGTVDFVIVFPRGNRSDI
jgi:hypothetical protein